MLASHGRSEACLEGLCTHGDLRVAVVGCVKDTDFPKEEHLQTASG